MNGAPWTLPLAAARDASLAGGKAVNLAAMLQAGLPVPDGFVVTTAAFRHAGGGGKMAPELAAEIAVAYRRLGEPAVAVRSSATAEDLPDASMAGQYETLLDVRGEGELLAAVERCWASLNAPRLQSYLRQHGIDPAAVALAVVVQAMVPAETAGVLFTANPHSGRREEMIVEASWGLGEAVVSGLVQPDRIVLDRATGAVRDYAVADKRVWIAPGAGQRRPVEESRRGVACLPPEALAELGQLGRQVADHFGAEQDIEWAFCGGRVLLLQSRPITTLADAQARHDCLAAAREQLHRAQAAGRGGWVRHNLAETLPHPTPLSWSILARFMSGSGGFGKLYRQVGFEPSATVCREGFLERIAGRVYMDLSRAGEMYFEGFPYRYDLDLLRCDPDAAQRPPTVPSGTLRRRVQVGRRLAGIERRLDEMAVDCDRRLDEELIPEFVAWVAAEKRRDLQSLSGADWVECWRQREARVLGEFGPQSLLPSLIEAMAVQRLRNFLEVHFWDERPEELLDALAVGEQADKTLQASQGLHELSQGRRSLESWLDEFGHRGPEEFDLAAPRWRERPAEAEAMAAGLSAAAEPLALHRRRLERAEATAERLAARLGAAHRRELRNVAALVRRYLRFREDGKHYLMLGYDLLRDLALEAGRRTGLGEDVFLLGFDELCDAVTQGTVPREEIQQRRTARRAESRLRLPALIAPDEIDSLGSEPPPASGTRLPAVAVSSGVCRGTVRVVLRPEEAGRLPSGCILVCPSTDPSWTPLMIQATGLVLECGGTLSHGAVVARELGLPAVVLPDATRILQSGERVTVDGRGGAVLRTTGGAPFGKENGKTAERPEGAACDPRDVRIPADWRPPPPGPRDRLAARLRTAGLIVWGVLLAAVFLLPAGVLHDPAVRILDVAFWPLVTGLGRPAAVAVLAVGLALVTLLGQRWLTDNRRLLEAARRAKRLRREADRLPQGSPRQRQLLQLAAPVQLRILGAAMVPLALLLGPLVMLFAWLPLRVDPASRNAKPGAVFFLAAEVAGEHSQPITLEFDPRLSLDPATAAEQRLPPIRPVLEELLERFRAGEGLPGAAEDESTLPRVAAAAVPGEMIADLAAYLERPLPLSTLAWTLRAPAGIADRFEARVIVAGAPPLCVPLVAGNRYPPELKEDLGDRRGPVQVVRPRADARSPVHGVRVAYQDERTTEDDVFWRPFGSLKWAALEPPRLARWDAGWLLTYVLAYIAALFPLRWLLRVA